MSNKRMLIAMAHPDDEAFGMGGTIAKYAAEGVEIHLICATNGDVGSADPEFIERHGSMKALRLAELECAAETLGIHKVYTFDYRDSGMAGSEDNLHPDCLACADADIVTDRIVRIIREIQPQVVVTFDPYGGYGHPDHLVMHQTTVNAFNLSGNEDAFPHHLSDGLKPFTAEKLYYNTWPKNWLKFTIMMMPLFGLNPSKYGRNEDMDLREIVKHDYPITTRINSKDYEEIREAGKKCHESQLGGGGAASKSILNRIISLFDRPVDTFMRAYPPKEDKRVEKDMFEGISA